MSRGLGRGLSALIPGAAEVRMPVRDVTQGPLLVPLERIHPNPRQPRRAFSEDAIAELAQSIRAHGVLQPLVVTVRDDGAYELIAGERRLRAAKRAGLHAVPVVVRNDAGDRKKLELALIENVQREDLNPVDRALAYRSLQDEFGLTQEELAEQVGVARSSIAHTMRLLALPEDMLEALRNGQLSEGHAKVLLGLTHPAEQRAWFDRILAEHIPVAAVGKAVRGVRGDAITRSGTGNGDPNLRAKERMLEQRLGSRVRIMERANGGGSITVSYHDAEEREGILGVLLG